MAHNVKAALPGRGTKKIFLLLALAITVHLAYNGQVEHTRHICEPEPHHGPLPHSEHNKLPGNFKDPEPQTFLAGATFNPGWLPDEGVIIEELPKQPLDEPQLPKPVEQEAGFTVMVNGEPIDMTEFEATNAQIMLAKNEALEGMTQLSLAGRKLLHKHHDDDDDHEWKHKKHDKKAKHDDEDEDDDDDDDDDDEEKDRISKEVLIEVEDPEPHHHHHHHPMSEAERMQMCGDAQRNEAIWFWSMEFCWALVLVYGYKTRRAIRRQLNIKGSAVKDYLSWAFCTPCAVAQETRTITKNNVSNGVWHNPTILISPQQPPVNQMMAPEPIKQLPV